MSVETDLRARLESLRINIEWLDEQNDERLARLITISSFSKRLLEYAAFLISSNLHADPDDESVETTGGGYCLRYRQTPESALSRALCAQTECHQSPAEMKLILAEKHG
jgi:hypothetical protein